LLSILRQPGEPLTLEDIAAWCDCEPSTIYRIQMSGLKKARWSAQNPALRRALLAAMKPPSKAAKPFQYQQQYGLIVVCEDEADQKKKFDQLKRRGLKVRVVTV
jgi:hypothetical protein